MLSKKQDARHQIEFVSIDQLVPKDHLLRKIERVIDFSFIYDLVKDKYSEDHGRPSIDPVVLIKILFIQYLFGIPSIRRTIAEIKTNVAYRWFLGYGLTEEIPHFSTFSQNYIRRFKGTDIFEKIFTKILEEAIKHGLVNAEEVFIDSTHVKASANKKKYTKEIVEQEARTYQEKLEEEINKDREAHGKKPLKKIKKIKTKEVKVSKTDPDSGMLNKNGKEKCFAYSFHTACDKNGFVLGVKVTAANVHDSVMFEEVLEEVEKRVGKPKAIAVDAGYKNPYILKTIFDREIIPAVPYTRPKTKDGFMKKHEFVYDEYYDCYICPQNEILTYVTTNREGYREYKSNPEKCKNCPLREKCTQSKDYTKRIFRHIWEGYVEEAEHLRHTPYCKEVYERRKETIERVFADLKEKHGLRWTTLRGKEKLSMQAMLVFAAMNLKKMALWLWRKGKGPFDISKLYPLFGVLKKILSRYIQPLLSVLRKQGLKFCFVNKLYLRLYLKSLLSMLQV